jgi:hypothetical protein
MSVQLTEGKGKYYAKEHQGSFGSIYQWQVMPQV